MLSKVENLEFFGKPKLDDIYFYLECGICRRNHGRLLTAVE
jgi:hypothetical protein